MPLDVPTYPITGIPHDRLPSGEVPLRVEVDDFYTLDKYAVQRNLFLLAMAKFEAMDPELKLSYFQVAGIHGLPHKTWDDPKHPVPVENGGYCPHNLVTFPTWHRPYMLLFEQRVYEIMVQDVIPTFDPSEHERLNAEARKWRLPYWDWATKKKRSGETVPVYDAALILKDKEVMVTTSIGNTYIPNPLYKFTTAPRGPMGNWGITPVDSIKFDACDTTTKHPHSIEAVGEGEQNVDGVINSIRKHDWYQKGGTNHSLGEAVNRLLSLDYITEYRQFATARYEPKDNKRDALSWEGIHNNLHNWIGGSWGHMAHVPVAAFDPVFWMHHANIDRIFAIYQALYAKDGMKSWWVKDVIPAHDDIEEEVYTPKSELSPFHTNAEGTTYNSNGVREIAALGYAYPELQRWKFPAGPTGDLEYIASIRAEINILYPLSAELAICRNDYIVNVVYERFALGGDPFTVEIFLRSEHEGDDDWLVGSVYNFSSAQEGCENCARQEQSRALSSGQVILTGALQTKFKDPGSAFKDGDKDKVVEFLKGKLVHRVLNAAGTQIEMPSLQVSVAVGNLTISKIVGDDGGYTLHPVKDHMEALPGLFGGVRHISEIGGKYSGTVTHKGSVYDVIKVTKGGESVDLAHTGYSEYAAVDVDVLSI